MRNLAVICLFSLLLVPAFVVTTRAQAALRAPSGLLCELLSRPERAVITDARPEFGWMVSDARRGARQTAYHILVASDAKLLARKQGDLWDSGKVNSDQSIDVEYAGKPLQSNTPYWWQVRTWDVADKASAWSQPQRFNVGALNFTQRRWPSESRWVKLGDEWVFENRHPISYHELAPSKVVRRAPQHYFIDFGKAAFATLKVTLTSAREAEKVEVHLGEKLQAESTVDRKPGGNIVYKKAELTLRQGTHTYVVELPRQRSSYPNSQVLAEHMPEVAPFRYAELIGVPAELTVNQIKQLALFYQFDDQAAEFTSSSPELNAVWDLCKYTLKATPFLGIYSDGTRERMPYEADAYIQQLGHYAVDREYAIARYTHEFLLFNPAWPTEWHLHSLLMAWADYQHAGNLESLRRFYNDLKAKTLLVLAREDGLISTRTRPLTREFLQTIHYSGNQFRDIVDWPQGTRANQQPGEWTPPTPGGETDGFVFTDYNTVVNAFHYRALVLMGEIANVLRKADEADLLRQRAYVFREVFNHTFFDQTRGVYVDGIGTEHSSLHANMFPLAFGLVPPDRLKTVVAFIKSRGMACSVYGAQYLLEALYEAGEADYALELLTAKHDRSWLHMLEMGSTMTTEAWDIKYKPNLDWNHAWGAAPANLIARTMFGIEPLVPSFKITRIKPQFGKLAHAKLKLPTIRGPILCEWRVTGTQPQFDLTIPANMTAQIELPFRSAEQPGAKFLHEANGLATYEIGAGSYRFAPAK
jgi:alpha-L-rhamnosidase